MRVRLIIFLVVSTAVSVASVTGQLVGKADDSEIRKPLKFKAPKTEYEYKDSTFVKSYSGGVYAWQEDVVVEAEEAIYLSGKAEAHFYGNATFKDSVRQLTADTLIYFYTIQEALAIGDVEVTEKGRLFKSGKILYKKNLRQIIAENGIYVYDDSIHAQVTGITGVFNDSTGYGVITGYPMLVREENEGSSIRITCDDTLEVIRSQRLARLWNNVVVTQDSLRVTAEHAVFDDSLEIVTLTGSPSARYEIFHEPDDAVSEIKTVSIISGDSMWVYLRDRKVSGVEVIGSAHNTTVSTDTTGGIYDESIIDSGAMRIVMADDLISLITAEGTAESYYHKVVADDDRMFVNEASGDTIYFFFTEGKITQMRITGAGGAGARGKYYDFKPEKAAAVQDSVMVDE